MAGEPALFELGVEDPRAWTGLLSGPVRLGLRGGALGQRVYARRTEHARRHARRRRRRGPYVFFAVDDMEAALGRVREFGGSVEEMDGEGDEESTAKFGRFKLCRDDQGSPFGLRQPPAGT
jgi:uncharacterized protein